MNPGRALPGFINSNHRVIQDTTSISLHPYKVELGRKHDLIWVAQNQRRHE